MNCQLFFAVLLLPFYKKAKEINYQFDENIGKWSGIEKRNRRALFPSLNESVD